MSETVEPEKLENESLEPEKLDLASLDIAAEKQAELLHLFPEVRTEGGKVDFERLRLALGETVEVGKERYGMNWPGKADCFRSIQRPSLGTLLPTREESVNFDETENLIIEGDNLEVLKLLQKSYQGKVKMIYIDPPYNTGNDFIYPDDYTENLQTYLEYTGQVDSEGKKFGTNTEADGRFHSKWLSMMYPRIYLARNLLTEDGAIFISIGEQEVSNLEKLCNEVFGEENRISIISRVAKTASDLGTFFAPSIDFVLCYAKNKAYLAPFTDEVDETLYKKVEKDGARAGEHFRDDVALYQSSQTDIRKNQKYFIDCPDGSRAIPPCSVLDEIQRPGEGRWRWSKEKYLRDKHLLVFKATKTSPLLDEKGQQAKFNIYTKSYLKDRQETGTRPRNYLDEFINRKGADLIKKFGIEFDYTKPVELVQFFLNIINPSNGDIVMDFFAGSGTTAHAVLERNRTCETQMRYLLVQLPEALDEDTSRSNNGLANVADICRERVRRVSKKLNSDDADRLKFENGRTQDRGFRAYKLAESNFTIWDATVTHDSQALGAQLELHVNHIQKGRASEDLLYEVLLKSGFPLTTPVETFGIEGKAVHSVANGAMLICLDLQLTHETIKGIADLKPERVVCLDEGFAGNDQLKTNAVLIMKSKGVTKFQTI